MNQEALLSWYERVKRPLPWRLEPSPWSILLSEILLQQTQMERGISYHAKLLERFPTVQSMAESSVDEVLHLWQGAGYYSRARRLHALSRVVMESYDGEFPTPITNFWNCQELALTLQQQLRQWPSHVLWHAWMETSVE